MRVEVCDVGPRDGLQNEPGVVEPAVRAELVDRLAAAGLPRIEAVSFVNPKAVPAMAGAEQVAAAIDRRDDVAYSGLALNVRGYERLVATWLGEVHMAFGVTEGFNRRNQNASPEESTAQAEQIVARAHADGRRATVTLSVAFGCPFEGAVDPRVVLGFAERLSAAGADEVVLADTIGVAVPAQVRRLCEGTAAAGAAVGIHLHNTRGTGLANAYAALEAGVRLFDASVGGLGGCPFAPRATGNIATEDLVYLLHGEGIETGVDLDGLIEVAGWLEDLLGRPLPGQVYRAGAFAPVAGGSRSRR